MGNKCSRKFARKTLRVITRNLSAVLAQLVKNAEANPALRDMTLWTSRFFVGSRQLKFQLAPIASSSSLGFMESLIRVVTNAAWNYYAGTGAGKSESLPGFGLLRGAFGMRAEVTCRVSSDHSILEGAPLVQVVADHSRVGPGGHLSQA